MPIVSVFVELLKFATRMFCSITSTVVASSLPFSKRTFKVTPIYLLKCTRLSATSNSPIFAFSHSYENTEARDPSKAFDCRTKSTTRGNLSQLSPSFTSVSWSSKISSDRFGKSVFIVFIPCSVVGSKLSHFLLCSKWIEIIVISFWHSKSPHVSNALANFFNREAFN